VCAGTTPWGGIMLYKLNMNREWEGISKLEIRAMFFLFSFDLGAIFPTKYVSFKTVKSCA